MYVCMCIWMYVCICQCVESFIRKIEGNVTTPFPVPVSQVSWIYPDVVWCKCFRTTVSWLSGRSDTHPLQASSTLLKNYRGKLSTYIHTITKMNLLTVHAHTYIQNKYLTHTCIHTYIHTYAHTHYYMHSYTHTYMFNTWKERKKFYKPSLVSLTWTFKGVAYRELSGRSTSIIIFSRKFGLDASGCLDGLVDDLYLHLHVCVCMY